MNKRILLSSISLFSSLALVTGATFAFFSDVGTSSNNTFAAGTLDLLLNGSDTADALFTVNNMVPGQMAAQHVNLTKAPDSVNIAKVGLNVTSSGTEAFQNALFLQVFEGATASGTDCVGGTEITTDIEGQVATDPLTVNNFTSYFDSLFDPAAFNNAGSNNVCFKVTFDSTAGNTLQGANANVTFSFIGLQDSSQNPDIP